MCVHKMRRAVHSRRDVKAPQIDLDEMSWGEEWLLDPFFIFPSGADSAQCYILFLRFYLFLLVSIVMIFFIAFSSFSYSAWHIISAAVGSEPISQTSLK